MKQFNQLEQELKLLNVFSLMAREELSTLYKFALEVPKNSILVELGSFCGNSSYYLAEAARSTNSKLFCVDSFKVGFDGQPQIDSRSKWHQVMSNNMDVTTLLDMTTHDAGLEFNQEIDFIFIDADHTYEGLLLDLQDWLPKVKSDGLVLLHDFTNTACPGIKRAFDEYTQDTYKELNSTWSLKVFKRP